MFLHIFFLLRNQQKKLTVEEAFKLFWFFVQSKILLLKKQVHGQ